MFTSTCILMLNNGMPPRVAGNRLSSFSRAFKPEIQPNPNLWVQCSNKNFL